MSDSYDTHQVLRRVVSECESFWRERKNNLADLERFLLDLPPQSLPTVLLNFTEAQCCLWAQRLEQNFGLVMYRSEDTHFQVLLDPSCRGNFRAPKTSHETAELATSLTNLNLFNLASALISHGVAHSAPEHHGSVAIRGLLRALDSLPASMKIHARTLPYENITTESVFFLSGLVRTGLRLGADRADLTSAVDEEAAFLETGRAEALAEWLPPVVTEAIHCQPAERWDENEFTNWVANHIRREAPKRRVALNDITTAFATEQDFMAREEAAIARVTLHALVERAGLASREREIWDLDCCGLTGAEIAERLHIVEGTVKATLSRVRTKLRNAQHAS